MKNKKFRRIKKIIPIILLIIIIGVICFFVGKRIGLNTDTSSTNTTIEDVKVEKQTISKTLTSSGEIASSETTNLELSTSYYFDSVCVEEGDIVKKGDKLVKYTNGKYLKAPYDLVVTKVNVPEKGDTATSKHYITVSNMEELVVSLNISESEITNISVGKEVDITLTSDSSKKYTGKITKIGVVGTYSSSGSTFPVTVSIENDGNIKIGMSVSCTINIEELKDVIAVPVGAVQINGDRRYVIVVDGKDIKEVDVTTGLSDDTYVQIKSGLEGGEMVRVVTVTKQNTIRSSKSNSSKDKNQFSGMPSGFDGNMPSGFSGERPSRPSSSENK